MYSHLFSERQHGLSIQYINMERIRRFLSLSILHVMHNTRRLYARELKEMIEDLLDHKWSPSRSIYETLNKMEVEGFVTSEWMNVSGGEITKHKRLYAITDEGITYLKLMGDSDRNKLEENIKLMQLCLKYVWGNAKPHPKMETEEYLSSTMFHMLFVFKYLYERKKAGAYLELILHNIKEQVQGKYIPSKRPIFQVLIECENLGFVKSKLDTAYDEKKRHIRNYVLTEKGREMVKYLFSEEAGIKNQILQTIEILRGILEITCGNPVKLLEQLQKDSKVH